MTAAARQRGSDAAASVHSVLSVPGMHCAGCMGKVERSLAAVPGVGSARTNLTARTVEVVHAESVEAPALIAALAGAGFEAQPRVVVEGAEAQVNVTEAEPTVNVNVPTPDVKVNQPAPQVTVEQPEPTVTVTQAPPEVNVDIHGHGVMGSFDHVGEQGTCERTDSRDREGTESVEDALVHVLA